MRHFTSALVISCFLTCGALARAQEVDLSSPKAAARSLYQAVDRSDAQAIREVLHTETDQQRQLADAFAEFLVSSKRLAETAKAKYGAAADPFVQGAVAAEDIARIESAEVQEESPGVASIALPGMLKASRFRRGEDGKWRLIITDFAGAAPERIQSQIAMTRDLTGVFDEVSESIQAGRYPTADDAEAALQDRTNNVMMRALRAATRPATAPATTRGTEGR
jgi:hypothetical protein